MTRAWLLVATAGCGGLVVAAGAVDAPPRLWWLVTLGAVACLAVCWRPSRWLSVVVVLSALGLASQGQSVATALVVGVLLAGFVLLLDLTTAVDDPGRGAAVESGGEAPTAAAQRLDLAGWIRCVAPLWLAGVGVSLLVALPAVVTATRSAWSSAGWLVAMAPLAALLAAVLAVGRTGPDDARS